MDLSLVIDVCMGILSVLLFWKFTWKVISIVITWDKGI